MQEWETRETDDIIKQVEEMVEMPVPSYSTCFNWHMRMMVWRQCELGQQVMPEPLLRSPGLTNVA